jgi:DNA primase
MSTPTEEIKSMLTADQVVGEYVKLTQAGQNWKGLCPFHNEKTPSFVVSPERNIWHCFGCGEGGDIFTFVMKMEGVEFSEALKILAKKAGVELRAQNPKETNHKNRLLDINDLAKKFFIHQLKDANESEFIKSYLNKRKVSSQSIDDFEIGYSLDSWDALLKFLTGKGYKEREIVDAGLLVEKSGGSGYYDRFRNRLMFPINNIHGQTVGFSARSLNKDDSAKYINSPQTQIYNKSEILYGLDKAKIEIKKRDYVILVEGQMDLISAHSVGSINAVATSGTALTKEQVNVLSRYTENLMFALDSDGAGYKAIDRGEKIVKAVDIKEIEGIDRFGNVKKYIDPMRSYKINIKVIIIPPGKDPDEFIKSDLNGWKLAIKNAQPIIDYFFDKAEEGIDISSLEGKKKFSKILLSIINNIDNKVEKDHYIKKISQKINVSELAIRDSLETLDKNKNSSYNKTLEKPVSLKAVIAKKREEQTAEQTLALFLKYPKILSFFEGRINPEILSNKDLIKVFRELVSYNLHRGEDFEFDNFVNQFKGHDDELFNLCQTLLLLAEKDFLDQEEVIVKRQASANVNLLEKTYILNRKKFLEEKIGEAESSGKEEMIDELMREVSMLGEKLVELDKEFD